VAGTSEPPGGRAPTSREAGREQTSAKARSELAERSSADVSGRVGGERLAGRRRAIHGLGRAQEAGEDLTNFARILNGGDQAQAPAAPRARGRKVLSLQSIPSTDKPSTPGLCAKLHGFSLHAAVRCGADRRKQLEHLCRYIARPAIANERLQCNRAGQVVLQLESSYKDGTTHIVMSPLEFMQRLAALVPRPRLHLIRFHGVLAPNAKLRSDIVPGPPEHATEHLPDHAHAQGAPARMSWARLLKRVFDIDIENCPNCGGTLKIIAAIEDPPVIVRILTHQGLPSRAPRSPARRFDLFQTV
jgi:hypothetical protein